MIVTNQTPIKEVLAAAMLAIDLIKTIQDTVLKMAEILTWLNRLL